MVTEELKRMGSMAMVEKRPGQQQQRRVGGCVGIFFQLLDWNRRLAKKKLFSRKLLPPGKAWIFLGFSLFLFLFLFFCFWVVEWIFKVVCFGCCVFVSVGGVKRVSKRFGGDEKMPTSKLKLVERFHLFILVFFTV